MVRRRSFLRLFLALSVFFLLLWGLFQLDGTPSGERLRLKNIPFHKFSFDINKTPESSGTDADPKRIEPSLPGHPVDQLITRANEEFERLMVTQTRDVKSAAAAYRLRRNRNPPPDFDKWVKFAQEKYSPVIEEMFDQIYHDLEPFWALSPKQLQRSVAGLEYVVTIRNGTMKTTGAHDGHFGIGVWKQMFQELKSYLPDVDLAFNVFDEPRLLVPWDNIEGYMQTACKEAKLAANGSITSVTEFPPLPVYESSYYDHHWMNNGNYWVLARDACAPSSPGRRAEAVSDFTPAPEFPTKYPFESHKGYVANWTIAKDPCAHPHLRGMHGALIAPRMLKTSKDLFPVFGGSKMAMNNDILLPQPEYWTEADTNKTGEHHWWETLGISSDKWSSKQDKVFWRGPATGGVNRRETWTRFHRHRFVSMMNSTQVEAAINDEFEPENFPVPDNRRPYLYSARGQLSEAQWIGSFFDGAFTDLMCFGREGNDTSCDYTEQYYQVAEDVDLWMQFGYKYLPDLDGDAFSPKYLALLRSTSLPIKATIFNEWHDSRLIPWKHFIPMDNTFVDFWGLMDYFLGGRDAIAKRIADDGRKWANTVLRREDMLVYVYRLVIEYARIMNDSREKMGFVADLHNTT